MRKRALLLVAGPLLLVLLLASFSSEGAPAEPYLVVLGITQDGGYPQTGTKESPAWHDARLRRLVVCLALVDPESGERWLFEATPDFREQLYRLDRLAPAAESPGLRGIFLTHAHIGHYLGLAQLGHEVLGAQGVPVYAAPRMVRFLSSNGPWDQLVRYGNIRLMELTPGQAVRLNDRLQVLPFLVPHRQEYSEVLGYRVVGPRRSVLFIPDIDSWEEWDRWGVRIEEKIRQVDVAYLDGTFFADGEIPGRDMSGFPHPFVSHSLRRLASLAPEERKKVRFIHLNHTNPLLRPGSPEEALLREAGFALSQEGERVDL